MRFTSAPNGLSGVVECVASNTKSVRRTINVPFFGCCCWCRGTEHHWKIAKQKTSNYNLLFGFWIHIGRCIVPSVYRFKRSHRVNNTARNSLHSLRPRHETMIFRLKWRKINWAATRTLSESSFRRMKIQPWLESRAHHACINRLKINGNLPFSRCIAQ